MPAPSYVHGTSGVPLLGETIGENLRRTVERFPDREALVVPYQGYRATYRELWEQTGLVARGLLARGVKKGDRVGIWSPNRFEWVVTQYATARIGAVLVNVNPAYRTHELEHVLKQSGTGLLVIAKGFRQASYVEMVREAVQRCPEHRQTLVFDEEWAGLVEEGRLAVDAPPLREVRPRPVDDERLAVLRAALDLLAHHLDVARLPESLRDDEEARPGLLQHVLELVRAVGGVHVDEDGADAGGRVLRHDPLEAVRRPDPDPVALLHAAGEEPSRDEPRLLPQLAVRGAVALVRHDERVAIREALDRAPQVLTDRLSEQRHVARAVHVGRRGHDPPRKKREAARLALE